MFTIAQKFCWAGFFTVLSFYSLAQDSLIVSVQDTLSLDTTITDAVVLDYSNAVDSAWLLFLEDRGGISNEMTLDSNFSGLPQTSIQYEKGFRKLNSKTPLNLTYNGYLDSYINEYLRYRHQLSKLLGLSKLYFPNIEEILDKNDIPLEMRNLCVIESALNPNARSHRGATGLWQFMLPTGKECGLTINSYVDERKDPIKSTEAACLYLNRLYKIYGVWELAIAAYNCGPGNVNKAIRFAGDSKSFWKIRPYLPRETQKYVPKFMAMCYLMEYGESHGVIPKDIDFTYWQRDTVLIHKELRFDQIAAFTDITISSLQTLNPQYKLKVIPASKEGNVLFIPVKHYTQFAENRDKFRSFKPNRKAVQKVPVIQANTVNYSTAGKTKSYYKVRSGDVLGTIAENHNITVNQLKRWNNIRGTGIRAGQNLVMYTNGLPQALPQQPKIIAVSQLEDPNYTYYTVREGDTLWDIAKLYSGVSTDDITRLNKDINPNNLKMGSKLKIKKI